jgi:hypothetical protein
MVVRHAPAQRVRERQHPLAVRDRRQDVLDQVLGLVRHLAAHAAGAEGALLAAEGHEAALGAVVTAEAGEAVPENAASQEATESIDHEAWQRAPGAGFQVALELVAEDLMERAGARVSTLVGEWAGWCSEGGGHRRGCCNRRSVGPRASSTKCCAALEGARRRPLGARQGHPSPPQTRFKICRRTDSGSSDAARTGHAMRLGNMAWSVPCSMACTISRTARSLSMMSAFTGTSSGSRLSV